MQKPFSANVKAPQELSRAMAVGILDLAIIVKLGNQMNRFAPQLTSITIRPMNPDSNRRDKKTLLPVAPLPQSDALGSRVSPEQLEQSRRMALAAVKAAAENRGQDIILLDLTEQTALFDFFVIATGSSRRQLAAMSSEIDRVLKYDLHERKMSVSGYEESRWIVLDYGSIVVHLFDEETREFYDLESLWADGKEVNISAIVAEASAQMARLSD